jgi:carbon-monoxide dehydrogenase medium subunit
MKAPPFSYIRPEAVGGVIECLQKYGDDAAILAGGQSLMASLNMRLSEPGVLIDINNVNSLSEIAIDGNHLRIGAMTRQIEVEQSPLVAQHAPLISMAMPYIAHPAVRNRGTIGGSIAFADPAAELPACIVTLQANLIAQGSKGERKIPATEFFRGLYETALTRDEVLVAIELPVAADQQKFAFRELARRHGDYAMIGVCAFTEWSGTSLSDVRLVYFNAGDRPVVAVRAAAALKGVLSAESLESALGHLTEDIDPPNDLNADPSMRLHLTKVLTKRIFQEWMP